MIETITPWVLADAEVALWAAWKDGTPMTGPGAGRGAQKPLFIGTASLSIAGNYQDAQTPADGSGAMLPVDVTWQVNAEFPDGVMADEFGRVLSRLHAGGYLILTVLFHDETLGEWTKLSFYYVTPGTDTAADSGSQVMNRTVALKSMHLQEKVGSGDPPALDPVVVGEVDWICGPMRVTALEYDPDAEVWTSLPRNLTGDGDTRYVTLTPITDEDGADVILAAYLPRVVPSEVVGDKLPRSQVKWQNTVAMRLGNQESSFHHGLVLQAGHALQAIGIVEPLAKIPQDRALDEPVIVFRYLRRVYATLGHGVFAVPRLVENESPPVSHDHPFRIPITGDPNPETGQSGLVLLPNGAWLDGTTAIHP